MKKVILCFILLSICFSGLTYCLTISEEYEIMTNLYKEGTELYNNSDFSSAAEKWEKGLKIARLINPENISVFINNLGLAYKNLDDPEKAILCYKEAIEIKNKIDDKKGVSNNLTNIGDVYYKLCNYPEAILYYEDALKIDIELNDKINIGIDLSNLGNVYTQLADYPKAISYYENALKIQKEFGDKKGAGASLGNLGVISDNIGDYYKAIFYYEEILKIFQEIGDMKSISNILNNLGVVYWNLGDYHKAVLYYENALRVKQELDDKQGNANIFVNLGNIYNNLGNYTKSISFYENALKTYTGLNNKKGIASSFNNLGVAYNIFGDYKKAIFYFNEAMGISIEIGDKREVAYNSGNIGNVYFDQCDYKNAISYYENALKTVREIEENKIIRILELNIADIYFETGEIEKAEKEYMRLGDSIRLGRLNLIKNNYSKAIEYLSTPLNSILESRNAEFLFASYCGLGEGYFGLKKYKEAKENYEKAITLTEEQREGLGEGEREKFFSAKIQGFYRTIPYEGMVRVGLDKSSNYNPEEAFFYSENIKARVLAEAIAKGQRVSKVGMPTPTLEEEENYIIKIRGLRKEMEALYRNKAMEIYSEKEKELKAEKAEQGKFISKLRKLHPEYASLNYPQPIKSSEVKLNENEVLIEFEVTDEKLYVFLLKRNIPLNPPLIRGNNNPVNVEVRGVPISRQELQEMVLKYRGYFEEIRTTKELLSFKPEVGNKLYSLLIGTMLDAQPEGTSIIIVPDEILGILPFEALVTELPEKEKMGEGEFGPFPLGVKYLGDKYSISYAQSATSLTLLRSLKKEKATGDMVLAVCDPIFSENDSRIEKIAEGGGSVKGAMNQSLINQATTNAEKSANTMSQDNLSVTNMELMGAVRDWKQMGVGGVKERGENVGAGLPAREDDIFPRLEKTRLIGQGMKELFGDKAAVLTGSEAKEEGVRKLAYEKYKYVTFATHGILDKAIPYIQEPAIVLSQIGNSEGYDGFLTMSEVMGLKIPAEVVALTACETGVGKNVSGEGVMGMGRAFQYAGCGNVLMSLWSVAEDATVTLSNDFFKILKEGKEPKEAIKLARNEIRRKGYEHPFFWSAFILVSR